MPENKIVAFDPLRAELAKAKTANDERVIDIYTDKGEKEARSLCQKFRNAKTRCKEIHKATKEKALRECQQIDAESNACLLTLNGMIDVWMVPIKEKAAAEQAKLDAIEAKKKQDLADIEAIRLADLKAREEAAEIKEAAFAEKQAEHDAEVKAYNDKIALQKQADELAAKTISDLKEAAAKAEQDAIDAQQAAEDAAVEAAKMAEENERLETERVEREKNIKLQAEKDARIEAERKAEQHKQDVIAAAKKALADAAAATKVIEDKRIADEKEADEKEAKRVADLDRREEVEKGIWRGIQNITGNDKLTTMIADAIIAGKIPHVTITY
jgi:hypothetical protein